MNEPCAMLTRVPSLPSSIFALFTTNTTAEKKKEPIRNTDQVPLLRIHLHGIAVVKKLARRTTLRQDAPLYPTRRLQVVITSTIQTTRAAYTRTLRRGKRHPSLSLSPCLFSCSYCAFT